jgi:hypothetical protein
MTRGFGPGCHRGAAEVINCEVGRRHCHFRRSRRLFWPSYASISNISALVVRSTDGTGGNCHPQANVSQAKKSFRDHALIVEVLSAGERHRSTRCPERIWNGSTRSRLCSLSGDNPTRRKNQKMTILKVEVEQFEWAGNVLIHTPTGAVFSWKHERARTGEVETEWKQAGDVLASGDEFDPSEIDILARSIMKEHEGVER